MGRYRRAVFLLAFMGGIFLWAACADAPSRGLEEAGRSSPTAGPERAFPALTPAAHLQGRDGVAGAPQAPDAPAPLSTSRLNPHGIELPTPTAPVPAPGVPGPKTVAVDPGHGGPESGAVHRDSSGRLDLAEKEVNLQVALALEEQLAASGFKVVLTRRTDTAVNVPPTDRNGDGRIDNDDDLQARVDIANAAGADLLVSIHHNGGPAEMSGSGAYYCRDHPLGAQSARLAALLRVHLLTQLGSLGYWPRDWGARDDAGLGKPYGHLFLVGPKTPRVARPSTMPGVVGEALFVTNGREAALLKQAEVREAIARAYHNAIVEYFQRG